jgi:Tol biopolymer transport system component
METHPLWSQDGQRLAYRVYRGGLGALHTRSSHARDELALKSTAGFDVLPTGWSRDGRSLLYLRRGTESGTRMDLWVLSLPDGSARPLFETPFKEMHARLSPDDRFVAYASDESGQLEIYVSAFPNPTARWPISTGGGIEPTWSRDGRELFYLSLDGKLMSVPIHRQDTTLRVGQPVSLFDLNIGAESLGPYRMHYQPGADSRRFLVNRRRAGSNASPIRVLLHWKTAWAE